MIEKAARRQGRIIRQMGDQVITFRRSLFSRLRSYFFAGVLVTAPVAITIYLTYVFVSFVDDHVAELIPSQFYPHTAVPGIGLVTAILFFILVGWLTRNVLGRIVVTGSDFLLERLPVVRIMYGALKQIFDTLMAGKSSAFREVVMFEDAPRRWAVGFVTGGLSLPSLAESGGQLVNVFRPFTPNPATGLLVIVPRQDLIPLNLTVEEAIKLIVSGGIITPGENTKPPAGNGGRFTLRK